MKVWLDDLRSKPGNDWVKVTTFDACIDLILHNKIDVLSLDHDLGSADPLQTGYDVLCAIECLMRNDDVDFWVPTDIRVHSDNPVGKQKMLQAIDSINFYRNSVGPY